jgi:hypothetical protein
MVVILTLCAFSIAAQTRYTLLGEQTIQQRLDLYKGDDTTREAALLKLFTEAGCQTANLTEQPVPHRKQPNIICVLPGSTPEVIVVGAHFDHVSQGETESSTTGAALRSFLASSSPLLAPREPIPLSSWPSPAKKKAFADLLFTSSSFRRINYQRYRP